MRILMGWEQYLSEKPDVAERYKAVFDDPEYQYDPEPMDRFYREITGHRGYWEPAPEYGERAWRIAGPKLSLIVWDEGNGWSHPVGVEIEVEKFSYIKRSE